MDNITICTLVSLLISTVIVGIYLFLSTCTHKSNMSEQETELKLLKQKYKQALDILVTQEDTLETINNLLLKIHQFYFNDKTDVELIEDINRIRRERKESKK